MVLADKSVGRVLVVDVEVVVYGGRMEKKEGDDIGK